jgi:hypothetical protein
LAAGTIKLLLKDVRIDQRTPGSNSIGEPFIRHMANRHGSNITGMAWNSISTGIIRFWPIGIWNFYTGFFPLSVRYTKIEIRETELILEPEKGFLTSEIKFYQKIFRKIYGLKMVRFIPRSFRKKLDIQSNMSIIDLIFCEGKNTLHSLR